MYYFFIPTQSPSNCRPVLCIFVIPTHFDFDIPCFNSTHFVISTLGTNFLGNRAVPTQSPRNPHANVALQLAPRKMVLGRPFPTQILDLALVCETGVSRDCLFISFLVIMADLARTPPSSKPCTISIQQSQELKWSVNYCSTCCDPRLVNSATSRNE